MLIKELFGLPSPELWPVPKHIHYSPELLRINKTRLIGVEVEVENSIIKESNLSGIWRAELDGSLRNGGIEWISLPIPARYAPRALKELLEDGLDSSQSCFSPRTSVHVHVDAQDLTEEQVINVTLLYAALEPLFYNYAGRGRIKNIYCVPLFDTSLTVGLVNQPLSNIVERWNKYTGFNLLPLTSIGTIEFRHMHGTFDWIKVSRWIRMITNLVEYAAFKGDIPSLIHSMNDPFFNFKELLNDIFNEDYAHLNFCSGDLDKSIDTIKQAFTHDEVIHEILKTLNRNSPYFTGGF